MDFKITRNRNRNNENGKMKNGKIKIENDVLYNIPANENEANCLYLRAGEYCFGFSNKIKEGHRYKYKSKRGTFIKIPLLPVIGRPGYISLEHKKTSSGHKYKWKWHHPATKKIINL